MCASRKTPSTLIMGIAVKHQKRGVRPLDFHSPVRYHGRVANKHHLRCFNNTYTEIAERLPIVSETDRGAVDV